MLAPNVIAMDCEVRSIFISDLHLGNRFARADLLLQLLESQTPQYLYLVGDIIDGWSLKRNWHWPESYNRLLDRIVELANGGTIIRFTPGNHDEFLRRFLLDNQWVTIRNEFIHIGADNRRFVIMHGDLFDDFEIKAKLLSVIGGFSYEVILRIDLWTNRILNRLGFRRFRISKTVKERVKLSVQFIGGFEKRVTQHAVDKHCDAVVCGHIHVPTLSRIGEVLYINLGDWIENNTALIEYGNGRLELIEMNSAEALAQSPPLHREIVDRHPELGSELFYEVA